MPLTARYLVATKNVPLVFEKIKAGAVPEKFSQSHLEALGFQSSNDRGFLGILKDLGFLTPDGSPTQRYKDYRDRSQSAAVMATALREMYSDLFLLNERGPSKEDRLAIEGRFKSTHSSNDNIARMQTSTYLALAELADFTAGRHLVPAPVAIIGKENRAEDEAPRNASPKKSVDLRYTIEVHLPATKDIEIYNAIFKSLRQNLLDD